MKRVDVRYDEESGCWHIFLVVDDEEREVAQHCSQEDAEEAADDIRSFSGLPTEALPPEKKKVKSKKPRRKGSPV